MKTPLYLAAIAFVMAAPTQAQETFATAAEPKIQKRAAGFDIDVVGDLKGFTLDWTSQKVEDGVEVVTLRLNRAEPAAPPRLTLKWSLPSHDIAGQWMTGRDLAKYVRPDWAAGRLQPSMFARQAPVGALFSSSNRNVLTFAVSDALNTIAVGSGVREEDGLVYNEISFFSERHPSLTAYTVEVRLDRRAVPYWTALADVADWWAQHPGYEPSAVPERARQPVYSTWYNYHQKVDSATLLKEVAIAKKLGAGSIIVDDGWQTLDSARGYAFTGDWAPERMPDMKAFVEACHKEGISVVLWYAVPFVGRAAKVVDRFKDKSLRYEERLGAYVLDPRYPEVRQYLIDVYKRALTEWGIDGFKLDFIERFAADEKTVLEASDGRDFASVNEATDRMMTDVLLALKAIKPEVMVEFRQPYIGPLIRKYGNMFRASDCPNSYLENRVRTVDLRLLSGRTAVHSDMIMWHYSEPVEHAAFQLLNVLFSVPQISVRLQDVPKDHFAMVQFWLQYWNANRAVLLDGAFEGDSPALNYPLLRARTGAKMVVGLYGDVVARLGAEAPKKIDVVNGKSSESVVLAAEQELGSYAYVARDCQGREVRRGRVHLGRTPVAVDVPVSGLLELAKGA
jgi:alpha-galactosidase